MATEIGSAPLGGFVEQIHALLDAMRDGLASLLLAYIRGTANDVRDVVREMMRGLHALRCAVDGLAAYGASPLTGNG
jgi:hypothetical protein